VRGGVRRRSSIFVTRKHIILTKELAMATSACKDALSKGFYISTPLVELEDRLEGLDASTRVFFKMDCLQPSGSFKDRGVGHMINTLHYGAATGPVKKLVCSSGGNAGYSVTTVARKLGIPVDVYVPTTTKPMMVNKLRARGANVVVHGASWNAADSLARTELADQGCVLCCAATAASALLLYHLPYTTHYVPRT
jgi:L-serine/L-threonine ammonia-lyase